MADFISASPNQQGVASRRFAETCFPEAIVWIAHQLGSFGNLLAS